MRPEQLVLSDADNKDLQLISLLAETGLTPVDVVNAITKMHNSITTPEGVLMNSSGQFILDSNGNFITLAEVVE